MLSIDEQIKKQIAQFIEEVKEAHDVGSDAPLNARLQLIGNTLKKLIIDIRERSFNVQVGKSINGMLSTDDCNVLLHSGASVVEILITDLQTRYDAA
ncbi:hypothetical protein [Vibrio parahaemolyticus]|uniref:hypothetical protein n=1 Tax=Vibrio parahaemolyticus TaxID=670 RepID=UPI0004478DB5|nr:hypothetical protein [Vibrio parahaemolyticus]ELY2117417.1 hypothetical protein [Vibrio parahaemolyticus]ETZ12240.1 hypothetical protein AJ90_25725 [Vibrio parahaemolyticus M0605]MBD6963684.1 hypothetical protein [Vibrio parahaemolyticus]TOI07433.1 hypothetical protein CGI68_20530 [Vibrio parahaemolyticus]